MEVAVDSSVSHTAGDSIALFEQMPDRVLHEDVNPFVNASFL